MNTQPTAAQVAYDAGVKHLGHEYLTSGSLTVETPWSRPPLTANQRLHWRKKADLTREVRQWAGVLFRSVQFDTLPVIVQLDWYVPDKRRRDVDNTVATLKPLCDGLVDAGVVPDDTPEFMDKRMPRIIHNPHQPARLVLTLRGGSND